MLVELIEIKQNKKGGYFLSNIYVNTQQIVFLSENKNMISMLQEGKINLGLNQTFTNFTNIRMNGRDSAFEITVVGDPGLIEQKIFNKSQKQLLRG